MFHLILEITGTITWSLTFPDTPTPSSTSDPSVFLNFQKRDPGREASHLQSCVYWFLTASQSVRVTPPRNRAFEEINTYFAPYSLVGGGLIKIVI